jgi:PAS domain S-box-containing protein
MNTAARLEQLTPEILRQWESRVRNTIPAARLESRLVLLNSIPHFMQELVQSLSRTGEQDMRAAESPREHAEQRAALPAYSLEQVVQEYSLLRGVILDALSGSTVIEIADLRVILDGIDRGVAEATTHYVHLQDQALRQSEERFRLLVAGVKDYAIFTLDPNGHVTSWNQGAERIKGYAAKEIIGKHFSVFYTPEDIQAGIPQQALATALREDRWEREGPRVRKDGTTFIANVVITAMRDENGTLRGFSKVTKDVTERRSFEIQLHERAQALAEANERKDEFLAMLSHELRNPLTPILTSAEILRLRADSPADVHRARDIIERQTRHLTRLVDDLLDVSRMTRGTVELRMTRVELHQLVQEVLDATRPFIEKRQQHLTVSLPELPIWLNGDHTRLVQVLTNLIHNSTKFSDPGGKICFSASVEANELVLQVRDQGIGIDAHLLPHVFDLFTQGARPGQSPSAGLGVGLALVRKLVEMHGGTVRAYSEGRGKGSEFTVRLPLAPVEAATQDDSGAGDVLAQAANYVLIVDDNVDAATSFAMLLGLAGHSVRVVHSGRDALNAALTERFSTILLDIGLPDIDGYEVAKKLRAMPALQRTRIIAVSGFTSDADMSREAGDDFDVRLVKPVDLATLEAALDRERGPKPR